MSRVFKVGIGPGVNLGIFYKKHKGASTQCLSYCVCLFAACMVKETVSPVFNQLIIIRLSLNVVFSVIGISH